MTADYVVSLYLLMRIYTLYSSQSQLELKEIH